MSASPHFSADNSASPKFTRASPKALDGELQANDSLNARNPYAREQSHDTAREMVTGLLQSAGSDLPVLVPQPMVARVRGLKAIAFKVSVASTVLSASLLGGSMKAAAAQEVPLPTTYASQDVEAPVVVLPSAPENTVVTVPTTAVPDVTTPTTVPDTLPPEVPVATAPVTTTPTPVVADSTSTTIATATTMPAEQVSPTTSLKPNSTSTTTVVVPKSGFVNANDGMRKYNSVADYVANNKTAMKAINECFQPAIRPQAVRVSFYESAGFFWAIGKVDKRDHGLFQINSFWHPKAFNNWRGKSWANPFENACEAADIRNQTGNWKQWAPLTRRRANVYFKSVGVDVASNSNMDLMKFAFNGAFYATVNDVSNSATVSKLTTLTKSDCVALSVAFPKEVASDPGCFQLKR